MIVNYRRSLDHQRLTKQKRFVTGSWVYVEDPSEEDVNFLAKKHKLDPILIKDALDPFEVPRMEVYDENEIYVFARIPHKEDNRITTAPVLIALTNNFIATVSGKELPFLSKFKEKKIDFYTTQKTKLFTQFFKEINHLYNTYLVDINRQVRKISGQVGKITEEDILHFVLYEEVLNTFVSDLQPIGTILKNLLTGKFIKLYEDDKELIEDILLSTEQITETARATLTSIVNIRGAYSTIVTNNLNRVIKVLTVLTILLTIPTIIASMYGMNIALPLANDPNAFWKIIVGIVALAGILLFIFKKNDWL